MSPFVDRNGDRHNFSRRFNRFGDSILCCSSNFLTKITGFILQDYFYFIGLFGDSIFSRSFLLNFAQFWLIQKGMSPRKSVHLPHAQDETIQALPSTFLYHLIEKLKHDVKSATTVLQKFYVNIFCWHSESNP